MQFNVAQQLREPIGSTRRYQLAGSVDRVPVEGDALFTRTDVGILVQAWCHTQATHQCARCNTLYTTDLDLTIEEEFFPLQDVLTGDRPPAEEDAFTIDKTHILDMTGAVREYAALARPIKPLCSPTCAGLCSQCGADLNQGPCTCTTQQGHPAFVELSRHWKRQNAL